VVAPQRPPPAADWKGRREIRGKFPAGCEERYGIGRSCFAGSDAPPDDQNGSPVLTQGFHLKHCARQAAVNAPFLVLWRLCAGALSERVVERCSHISVRLFTHDIALRNVRSRPESGGCRPC